MFVDEARILVKSGKGGDGSVSFQRQKYQPKGGPDGGDGGRGASVVLVAGRNTGSLSYLKDHPHQKAASGGRGAKNNRTGKDAEDLVLDVPLGTLVKLEDGTLLADLAEEGDRVVVARGGRGGRGNAAFASQRRRVPGFAELGEPGEEMWVRLELSLIADVAVIGLPNAGKSTLVGKASAASPKVADYAFTTLEPSLGVVEVDETRFTICDIPGLIEGAHSGKGLGTKFLRHARRALVFLHMVDMSSLGDLLDDYRTVRAELIGYAKELGDRPELVALNKADKVRGDDRFLIEEKFKEAGLRTVTVSAETGEGIPELVTTLATMVAEARRAQPARVGYELKRDLREPIKATREGQAWRLTGGSLLTWVAMTDLSNPEAVSYLQQRMEKAGTERVLKEVGASHGDQVLIGDSVFEWWPAGSAPPDA